MASAPNSPDRPPLHRPHLHRRDVLRGGAFAAAGIGAASLLSACSDNKAVTAGTDGELPYQLATPDNPVTQPLKDSNPAIEDGLKPETGGVLKVLNYADYIAPGVLNDFGDQYNVEIEVTPYDNYDQMISKLQEPGAQYDVVFPGPTVMSKMVYGELLQPLNHTYLPNMDNIWPEFQDPWYDKGAQYSIPYTIYSTGIAYRTDRVSEIPNPGYDLVWDPQYSGKVGILDDYMEAIDMSILRNDLGSIRTDDQTIVAKAVDSLIELIDLVNVKVGITAYRSIPEGEFTIHQTWSGDMLAGRWYLPKGVSPDVLGYWVPDEIDQRVIGNDCICIPKGSTKPVLAHTFLNNLIDEAVSERNFNWNGYQPPLTKITVPYSIEKGYISETLTLAIVQPEDFRTGLIQVEQAPSVEAMWRNEWARFKAGA